MCALRITRITILYNCCKVLQVVFEIILQYRISKNEFERSGIERFNSREQMEFERNSSGKMAICSVRVRFVFASSLYHARSQPKRNRTRTERGTKKVQT